MKFMRRSTSKGNLAEEVDAAKQQQQQRQRDHSSEVGTSLLKNKDNHVFCTVRPAWMWIMQEVCDRVNNVDNPEQAQMTLLDNYQELPSGKLASVSSSVAVGKSSRTGRSRRTKVKSMTALQHTLRIDIVTNHGEYQKSAATNTGDLAGSSRSWTLQSFHGTSEAFDGLEDKDEFVRTLKRCRCEHLELSPPSVLINWDVSQQECLNLVGDSMPTLLSNDNQDGSKRFAVLKEPMGKGGAGVFFVHDAQEIHEIIESNRKKAVEEPGFLDELIAHKGRIPSWVLQAEVQPCLLIRDRRKFHIRTYVVCVENVLLDYEGEQDDEGLMKLFIYNRHEIRIANAFVPEEDTVNRDRNVHIMDVSAERTLLEEEPELVKRNLAKKVELFAAQAFSKHLRPDIERRIALSASATEEENEETNKTMVIPHKFVIAGLDFMVTEDERIYLLEVNVNPSAPDVEGLSPDIYKYLIGLETDLIELVTTKGESASSPGSNFMRTETILQQKL